MMGIANSENINIENLEDSIDNKAIFLVSSAPCDLVIMGLIALDNEYTKFVICPET